MAARRPSPTTRLLAWLYTGPVGHLYGGLADLTELLVRAGAARARGNAGPRGRVPTAGVRP